MMGSTDSLQYVIAILGKFYLHSIYGKTLKIELFVGHLSFDALSHLLVLSGFIKGYFPIHYLVVPHITGLLSF